MTRARDPLRQPEIVSFVLLASPVSLVHVRGMLDDGAYRLTENLDHPDHIPAARVAMSLVRQIDQVLRRRGMDGGAP